MQEGVGGHGVSLRRTYIWRIADDKVVVSDIVGEYIRIEEVHVEIVARSIVACYAECLAAIVESGNLPLGVPLLERQGYAAGAGAEV